MSSTRQSVATRIDAVFKTESITNARYCENFEQNIAPREIVNRINPQY